MAEGMNQNATYMFMCLEGVNGGVVQGETKDSIHANEIQLTSFEMKVAGENAASREETWKANFDPVTLTIVTSKASPSLFKAACCGTTFKRVTISCRKHGASKTNADFMQWRFNDVQVVEYSLRMDNDTPVETIKISYQVIEVYYARQDQDGTLKDTVKRSWSLDENKDAPITLPWVPKN